MLARADQHGALVRGDADPELVICDRVRGGELLLLRPRRPALRERVRRALTGKRNVVRVRADDRGPAVDGYCVTEKVARETVRGSELLLLAPGGPALGEDVRRPGGDDRRDVVLAGSDEGERPAQRHRVTEEVGDRGVARLQLLLLTPRRPALAEDVRRPGGRERGRHVVLVSPHERGGSAQRNRPAEEIEGRFVAAGDLLLLAPRPAAQREDVRGATLNLRAGVVGRGADDGERAAHCHALPEGIGRGSVARAERR